MAAIHTATGSSKAKVDTIRSASKSDKENVIATLTLAFSSDPMVRWAMHDANQYLTHFPEFVEAFAGNAFSHGTAYSTDGYAGAALWLPPSVEPDYERMIEVVQRTVPEENVQDLFEINEQMEKYHPKEPHWYLPVIGVDPTHQSQGLGALLMSHALAPCDRDGLVAYLESSNTRNIPLYERFGFEVIGEIRTDASPTIYPMLRKPLR